MTRQQDGEPIGAEQLRNFEAAMREAIARQGEGTEATVEEFNRVINEHNARVRASEGR